MGIFNFWKKKEKEEESPFVEPSRDEVRDKLNEVGHDTDTEADKHRLILNKLEIMDAKLNSIEQRIRLMERR